jgi:hypothetical protein
MIYLLPKQSLQIFALILSTTGLFVTVQSHAEIYKWTDAQGKVHYSDKKIADSAQAQDLNLGTMPDAKSVASGTAIRYQNTRPSLYILRGEIAFDQLATLRNPTNFAYFYFGGDCVSPTAASYEEYIKRYRNSLPRSYEIFRDEGDIFRKNKYRNQGTGYAIDNPRSVTDEEGNPPVKLHIDIVDMRINACIQRLQKTTVSGNLDKISGYNFDKANVWLQLRATLSTFNDDVVLLNTIIEGAADQVDGFSGNISKLTIAAYEQAITNLLATPQFTELVTPKSKIQTINVSTTEPPAPAEEGGMLNRLADKFLFNSIKKSKLAETLSLVNPVRFSIVQYYADTGKWPSSFSDIDLNASELQQKDLIDSAELRLGGVLHIRLAKSTFGDNEILQLIPKSAMGGQTINWECRTSLDKAMWVGECKEQ